MTIRRDGFAAWLAWRLPRRLVYWCGIRLWSNATTGAHSGEIAPGMDIDTVLDRWGTP